MPDEKKITNYPSNSHKAKEQTATGSEESSDKKKLERVTTSDPVKVKKKSLGKRIAETFTGDDMQSVGQYLLFEVFIPAAKNLIVEATEQGIQRMLYGDTRPRSSGHRPGYTSYNNIRSSSARTSTIRQEPRTMSRSAQATHNFDEIVLESRAEAETVLERLIDTIDTFDVATVSDLYDLVGISGSFVDSQWGWTDLRDASLRRVRDGYLLNLPKTDRIR